MTENVRKMMSHIPWERDRRGLFIRYNINGAKVEERWDGESDYVTRTVTMPMHADRITMEFFAGNE